MEENKSFQQIVEQILVKDSRYKPDSYEFVMQALHFTQSKLKKKGHISGRELSLGMRDLAVELYGPMAKTVLSHWGITATQDFGNIVFNMIEQKILSKTEEDSLEDFREVYDFEEAFSNAMRRKAIKEFS